MVFSVARTVSFISEIFTLHPGDIIAMALHPALAWAKSRIRSLRDLNRCWKLASRNSECRPIRFKASPYASAA